MNAIFTWIRKKVCSIELYAAIAAIFILIPILLISPITGVANNGDYGRIMTRTGLEFITDSRFVNIDQEFKIVKNDFVFEEGKSYFSSHLLPVIGAITLNKIIKSRETFDIRFLGIVYSGIFVLSIYLLAIGGKIRNKVLNIFYAILLVLIFCDIGYVSYFNSFLGEAATLVFFLLMLGIMASIVKSKKISVLAILCFFISAILYISAKQSNVPMGVFIVLFGLSILFVDRRRKIVVTLCISSIILLGLTFFLYSSAPASMEMITKHQTVFYGILKDSPTPEEDLEFMGLPRSLAVLKELSYYDPGLPIASDSDLLKKEFYNKVNFGMVLKFYLYHPQRFLEKLEVTAQNSMMIRTPYLGNLRFDNTGERFSFNNRFSLWSTLKKTYMPTSLLFVAIFFMLYLLVLLYEYIKSFRLKKGSHYVLQINMFLLLWITGAAQFVIPVLGDGEVDLAKHMFSFNICFDLMIISAVIWSISNITVLFQKHKLKPWALPAILSGLILIFSAAIMFEMVSIGNEERKQAASTREISPKADIGDYLKFGRYGGEDIVWQVINKNKNEIMIMADKIISFKPYDVIRSNDSNPDRKNFGSNNWGTSALRIWLNSAAKTVDYGLQAPNKANVWKGRNSYAQEPGFLYEFTDKEKNAIKTIAHKSIISTFDIDLKNGGDTYYFWTNCIPLLIQNYNNAFYQNVEDKVFLLDVKELKEYVYDNGLKYRKATTANAAKSLSVTPGQYVNYWLRTPYATRASFVRYVGSDGYVYHKDAYYGDMGVLPVLCVDIQSLSR